jgi:hypothetical protein
VVCSADENNIQKVDGQTGMTNPEKTFPSPMVSNSIILLLGVFLAAFAFSFLMDGFWAFVLAMLGGAANSISLRFVKIIMNKNWPGLVAGYFAGIAILIWAGKHWDLSVNLWVSAVYVFTLGIVPIFISEAVLTNWLNKIFRKGDGQNKSQ